MFSTTKTESTIVRFTLTILLFFPVLLFAQQGSYMGNEPKLNQKQLLTQAVAADFGNNISSEILKDEKNAYFAVDGSKLASKFEKIRFLELSYTSNVVVSIGYEEDMRFYYFLVNNTLNKSREDINTIFNEFLVQSKTELQTMNEEQIRLWLLQHDKYSTK